MSKQLINDKDRLDKLNNERVETTKMRVVHAIRILSNPIECLKESRRVDNDINDIAHAVNLLENAVQEMQWACEHFEWNDEVCTSMDDACAKLGNCLAILIDEKSEEYDPQLAGFEGYDAVIILGKVLATLVRWFDDTQNVSEV